MGQLGRSCRIAPRRGRRRRRKPAAQTVDVFDKEGAFTVSPNTELYTRLSVQTRASRSLHNLEPRADRAEEGFRHLLVARFVRVQPVDANIGIRRAAECGVQIDQSRAFITGDCPD